MYTYLIYIYIFFLQFITYIQYYELATILRAIGHIDLSATSQVNNINKFSKNRNFSNESLPSEQIIDTAVNKILNTIEGNGQGCIRRSAVD